MDDDLGEITMKLFAQNFDFVGEILKSGTADDQRKVLRLLNERGLTDTGEIPAEMSVDDFVSQAQERLMLRRLGPSRTRARRSEARPIRR